MYDNVRYQTAGRRDGLQDAIYIDRSIMPCLRSAELITCCARNSRSLARVMRCVVTCLHCVQADFDVIFQCRHLAHRQSDKRTLYLCYTL